MIRCGNCGGTFFYKEEGEVKCMLCARSPDQAVVIPSPETFRCGHPKTLENMVPVGTGTYAAERCRTCMAAAQQRGQVERKTKRGESPQITPSDRRTRVA